MVVGFTLDQASFRAERASSRVHWKGNFFSTAGSRPHFTRICLYCTLMFWIIPWSMCWVIDVVLGSRKTIVMAFNAISRSCCTVVRSWHYLMTPSTRPRQGKRSLLPSYISVRSSRHVHHPILLVRWALAPSSHHCLSQMGAAQMFHSG